MPGSLRQTGCKCLLLCRKISYPPRYKPIVRGFCSKPPVCLRHGVAGRSLSTRKRRVCLLRKKPSDSAGKVPSCTSKCRWMRSACKILKPWRWRLLCRKQPLPASPWHAMRPDKSRTGWQQMCRASGRRLNYWRIFLLTLCRRRLPARQQLAPCNRLLKGWRSTGG